MSDYKSVFSRMTPREKDIMVRLLLAEAGNQGTTGMEAVGSVIGNRSLQSGMTPYQVMTAKGQFEPMSNGALSKYGNNSPAYQNASGIVDRFSQGQVQDPTGGATHFYSPKAQAALGRQTPSWAQGQGTDIGDHRFYNLGYQPAFASNRHGIPQRPQASVPQAPQTPQAAQPPQTASAQPFRPMAAQQPASMTGSRYDDGTAGGTFSQTTESPILKNIGKSLGFDETDQKSFELGLALGGSDPFKLFGGFNSGGFGAEGIG